MLHLMSPTKQAKTMATKVKDNQNSIRRQNGEKPAQSG